MHPMKLRLTLLLAILLLGLGIFYQVSHPSVQTLPAWQTLQNIHDHGAKLIGIFTT